ALACVLGVGEGHLLHRKTQRVESGHFAKIRKSSSEFPQGLWTVIGDVSWFSLCNFLHNRYYALNQLLVRLEGLCFEALRRNPYCLPYFL
ncbi:hypothetical protein, partial [Pseudomonas aeruginosa]|uniref:hypothetical protein n=1 Tax=Pseudomonas aeruginosa TaxID=287 RepID=UPI001ADCEC80